VTEPRRARKSGSKRYYSWRDENYWSVSVVKDILPKVWLVPWTKKWMAHGIITKQPVLQAMLDLCTSPEICRVATDPIETCKSCASTAKWLKDLPYTITERAQELGTMVHSWMEAATLGKPMPICPLPVRPYLAAFEKFVADFKPEFEMTEATVYNRTQRYAGTLDALVRLPHFGDGLYVLDAKSGKDIYSEVAVQLAAYRKAEFIGLPDGSEQEMLETAGGFALHLQPTGYRLVEVNCGDDLFQVFLFAREILRWDLDIKDTVLGEEYSALTVEEEAA
jgi:hypothetical protein